MTWLPLKRFVDPLRPITYGIVQAGPDFPGGVRYIRPADMTEHDGVLDVFALRTTSPDIASQYRRSQVKAGDIVVSIGPSFGKTMIVPADLSGANLTQGTARVAPGPRVDARFLRWALRASQAIEYWETCASGATFRALNLGPLTETPIPSVTHERQRAIADYLDAETARLDALIAKQGETIELLEERLSARVHTMLSHGPRVPLKRLVDPLRPITYGIVQAGPPVDGGVPYIRPIDMDGHDGVRDVAGLLTTTPDIAQSYRRSRVRKGDLVVSIGPSFGKTMVVPPELSGANLTQGTARIAPAAGVDVRFLRWALRSQTALDHWEGSVGGATFRALNLAPLASTPVPNLPLDEQIAAADRLDREEQSCRRLIVAKRALIDLLEERRETLIARAVSGDLEIAGTS